MLTFDEPSHAYAWNGVRVPSVTQVLAPLMNYSFVNPEALEVARQEGMAIHKTVELYCRNDLDEDDLPDWLGPRLDAFKKFVADTQFQMTGSEELVYHETYKYAGTFDLSGTLALRRKRVEALIDIKRSFAAGPVIGLQVAAYAVAQAHGLSLDKAMHRYALQLRADGTYRLEAFEDPTDFTVFLACLSMHKWKERHGKH